MSRRLAVAATLGLAACNPQPSPPAAIEPATTTSAPPPEIAVVAEVDADALELALATVPRTHTHPRAARSKPRARVAPRATVARASGPASGDVWEALARCESGNRNDGGAPFYGFFQFSAATFRSLGYTGTADQHPYGVQLEAAQRLQARSGWSQWPSCSRKIGVR